MYLHFSTVTHKLDQSIFHIIHSCNKVPKTGLNKYFNFCGFSGDEVTIISPTLLDNDTCFSGHIN